jgi:hypothetical protein
MTEDSKILFLAGPPGGQATLFHKIRFLAPDSAGDDPEADPGLATDAAAPPGA